VFGRMTSNIATVSVEDEMQGDVYSYAIILWEMMTRKIPWANCNTLFSFYFIFLFFFSFYFMN